MATIVKLTRALMIVPVCLGLIGLKWYRSKQQGRNKGMLKKIIPWFIIWFYCGFYSFIYRLGT